MQTILVVFHIFLSIALIGVILIQHGKGADAGAAFGSGASSTVFGARGSASFLTRGTAGMATLFFLTSMALGYFSSQTGKEPSLMEAPPATVAVEEPGRAPGVPEVPPAPDSQAPFGEADAVSEVPPAPSGAVPMPAAGETQAPAKAAE